jgi:hypothetical protein
MRIPFVLLLLAFTTTAAHGDEVSICYNYGCNTSAKVVFSQKQLDQLHQIFMQDNNAAEERLDISKAIGVFETFSGQQTPTWQDKGGNSNDDGVNGRMDCIDHSHNTTQYLQLLQAHGWLKFHHVLAAVKRAPLIVNVHWAAQIEEIANHHRFVVDSWFFDNGKPALVMDLNNWMDGGGP